MNMLEMLQAAGGESQQGGACKLSGEDAIAALREGFARYTTAHRFKPGQLIIQKDGLSSFDRAGDRAGGNPAVFIRYEDGLEQRVDRPGFGSPYSYGAPDCLVGWLHADGGFVVTTTHSPDFEPFEP